MITTAPAIVSCVATMEKGAAASFLGYRLFGTPVSEGRQTYLNIRKNVPGLYALMYLLESDNRFVITLYRHKE